LSLEDIDSFSLTILFNTHLNYSPVFLIYISRKNGVAIGMVGNKVYILNN